METRTRKTRTSRKATARTSESAIMRAYIDYVLDHGTRPPSVFKFCSAARLPESAFFDAFGSFEGLERRIWREFIDKTIARLKADKDYAAFSAREKILAFYYTLFEELKDSRSFILIQLSQYRKVEFTPTFLKDFRKSFETFVDGVLAAGKTDGEVASRPYLDKQYAHIFWLHLAFILIFWKDDSSAAFENTDAAIEKSVNLAFDLIGKGAVDSALDFAKFLYQTRVK